MKTKIRLTIALTLFCFLVPFPTILVVSARYQASSFPATCSNLFPTVTLKTTTSQATQSNSSSKSWHEAETWGMMVTPLIPLSFADVLNELHDVENKIDDGSDDPQDKWGQIKRRIQAIRNLSAIVLKKIYRVACFSFQMLEKT
jgi:hypothetical protein